MERQYTTQPSNTDSISDADGAFSSKMQFYDDQSPDVQKNESLMADLNDNEELSLDDLEAAQRQFPLVFANRYRTSGPPFYCGPLDEGVTFMFDTSDQRPLILYVHNDRSVAAHIFCNKVLCDDKISDYLAEKFVIWPWDRTCDTNYNQLLIMLDKYVGRKIKDFIASFAINDYPLLICLIWNEGQVEVIDVIQGMTSSDDTFQRLVQARNLFDSRIVSPPPLGHQRPSFT